jgi:hypothetical protein
MLNISYTPKDAKAAEAMQKDLAAAGLRLEHSILLVLLNSEALAEALEDAPDVRVDLEEQVSSGVVAAGVGSDLPPNGTQLEMTIRMVNEKNEESMYRLSPSAVTPGYLEALGVTVKSGRLFEERDREAARPPIVITEASARMMFSDRDPVGRDWPASLPGPAGKRVTPVVIGVVGDIKHKGLDSEATAVMFAPWERLAPSNAHLLVRTSGSPERLRPAG